MKQPCIGVDIGGTNTVIGVFDESMSLAGKKTIPTLLPHLPEVTDNPAAFYDYLTDEIIALVKEAGFTGRLKMAGMGVPGQVDPVAGVVEGASNLGWVRVPFASEMSRKLGAPVWIDNDVRIYAIGEMTAGAGQGYRNLLCLTIGTGMASAFIADGRIVRGGDNFAGDIGHDAVEGNRTPCACGEHGCVETIVSARGIVRMAREAVASGVNTSLSLLKEKLSAYEVYKAASNGDSAAQEIFRYAGEVLGSKLLTAVYLLNPEAIIIGGGVAEAGEMLLAPVREKVYKRYHLDKKPDILRAQLGDVAGLIGAVTFAKNNGSIEGFPIPK